MIQNSELSRNKLLLKNFLYDRKISSMYIVNDREQLFGYIYCIENLINGKKYIGSNYATWLDITNPTDISKLQKRAVDYIYEYNCNIKSMANGTGLKYKRPISKAIYEDGIENFIMYPVAETREDNHKYMENYFIDLYNTRKNGYNVYYSGAFTNRKVGYKMSEIQKLLRSTGVICVNMSTKEILFSDSMKLFGDYLDKGKDIVKNMNRGGRPLCGWYIFYLDAEKRLEIQKKVLTDDLPKTYIHSKEAKEEYRIICDNVTGYLIEDENSIQFFSEFNLLLPLQYIK